MTKMIDMIGKKIGRLTVIERGPNNAQGKAHWKCLCDCGKIVLVSGTNLRNGKTQSCGCLQRDRTSEASRINIIG